MRRPCKANRLPGPLKMALPKMALLKMAGRRMAPPSCRIPASPAPTAAATWFAGRTSNSLFEELADPGNEHWERTQAQIYAAWNRSGSPSMNLLAERADKAVAAHDYDTALIHLNDLTRLAPGFAEGWNKRATVYFLRDEYGRSLGDIARVLALEPRHFGAYSGLGIILDRLGDKEGALEAYQRAVAINPNLPGAAEGIKKLKREVEGERL